jgi:hypothetical protein
MLIICTGCGIALEPHSILYHLRNLHNLKKPKLLQSHLDDLCNQYRIPAKFLPIQGPIPQIQGLTLYRNGVQCEHCGFMSGQRNIVTTHHQKMHVKDGLNAQIKEIALQRLSSLPDSKKYFSVLLADAPSGLNVEVQDLRHRCDAAYVSFAPSDNENRTVSPWLLTTRWHEHVAKYDSQKLRQLVEFPNQNEAGLARLEKGVLAVMKGGMNLIVKTPVLVLQKLNSPDPAK